MEKMNRGMRAVGVSPFPRVMRMVVVVFGLGCLFCVWCVCLCLLLCSSSSVANKAFCYLRSSLGLKRLFSAVNAKRNSASKNLWLTFAKAITFNDQD